LLRNHEYRPVGANTRARPSRAGRAVTTPAWARTSRLAAEQRARRQTCGARELAAGDLLPVFAARAQHFDEAALRGHLEARVGNVGDLADLALHVGEAAEKMLARVENLDLLAAKRAPRSRRGVAAADEVVDRIHVVAPGEARLAVAAPALVARPRLV